MKASQCRGCGSPLLETLYDFGEQPLAGNYPELPESVRAARKYPLDFSQCGRCGLLQVLNMPPIDEVFHEDYRYSSSTVPGLVRHFAEYAEWLHLRLRHGARVFEFGCNDGVLLERLQARGIQCEGVDASDNVASLARAKGLKVDTGFLNEEYVRKSASIGRYDLATCSNVFAHIHDIVGTIAAVRLLLKQHGLFVIEVHDGELLSSQHQFDTIYHEHLTYFTERTLRSLLERNGFEFVLCARTTMHGGGLRFLAKKTSQSDVDSSSQNLVGASVERCDFIGPMIRRCRQQLHELHAEQGPIVGYGAAGRSQMFINVTASAQLFSLVYDDSPFRQGRFIAGTNVPIKAFHGDAGNCAVVLAWNYADDISRKVRGSFNHIVTLLPELRFW